ncbi:MAG: DUF2950 domain-containing protein [Methyloligellaceae bacterium]
MKRAPFSIVGGLATSALLALLMLVPALQAFAETAGAKAFPTPEKAVAGLIDAAKRKDVDGMLAILGPETKPWISSGDPVQDQQGLARFITAFDEKNGLERQGDAKAVLVIGNDGFPFPFPIVKTAKGWAFDAEQGREELLARRIGRNELNTMQVLLAIVDAQGDYAAADRNGDGALEYAAKFLSAPGKQDGLYWPTGEGEPQSPLGPLVAEAVEEGYGKDKQTSDAGETRAYHGYHFKLLKRQGADAPGGAYDYVVGGLMIGGFAVLAYPARYGNSGVMTFMVSHDGAVFEADLGPETPTVAQALETFNPGEDWKKVKPE